MVMNLDTRITGAPLPPSMAKISEHPMDAIIILSGTGPDLGLGIHIMMDTLGPPHSPWITLPGSLSKILQRQKTGQAFPLCSQIPIQGSYQGLFFVDTLGTQKDSRRSPRFHEDHHSRWNRSSGENPTSRVVPPIASFSSYEEYLDHFKSSSVPDFFSDTLMQWDS